MRRVFVSCISEEENLWWANLQDDVDGPVASINGERENVLKWARAQEADQHWLHGPDGLVPLA
jgi:hypothetical protein